MAQIKLDDFCDVCVVNGLYLGINPHYLAALAFVRSGVADPANLDDASAGAQIGPYRINNDDWDRRRVANDIAGINIRADRIGAWEFQVEFAALTAFRAWTALNESLGHEPNALELYKEQWPDAADVSEDVWQNALDKTADAMEKSLAAEFGAPPGDTGQIKAPTDPVTTPTSPRTPAEGDVKNSERLFVEKAPGLMTKLMTAFPLKDFQAAAILGNIGEECGGFHLLHEQTAGGGEGPGLGWAQWSFGRRTHFEAYCANHGLSTSSDAGNFGFLVQELRGTMKAATTAVEAAANITNAVQVFEQTFEKAHQGLEHFDMRNRFAKLALDAFRAVDEIPAPVAALLDSDLNYHVLDKAQFGVDVYWLIEQAAEHGAQIIVKQTGQTARQLLMATSVFPLPNGLLPSAVATQFSQKRGQPVPVPPGPLIPGTVQEVAGRMVAQARAAVGTLVTHDVPGTSNGRLACAWAVNHIAKLATGHEIGGGLNSDLMCDALQAKHIRLVTDADVIAGAIVISPSKNGRTGHVGIVGEVKAPFSASRIYSNSSSHAIFMQNYTVASWRNYFTGRGLEVRFYLYKG